MRMLRLFSFPATFRRPVYSHRNLVFCARTWDNENIANIRKELKGRGLVSKGIKAPPCPPGGVRHTSTVVDSSIPGVTPGIPLSSQMQTSAAAEMLPTRLPDLSQPEPETPIQIPYLPDFWNSSEPIQKVVPEETTPKILLVAGAATHPGGGPSHNLLDLDATSTDPEPTREDEKKSFGQQGGLWDDIAEDLSLPPPKKIKKAFWNVFS